MNNCDIFHGVLQSQTNPQKFIVGLSREHCSSFTNKKIEKYLTGVPVLCLTFRFPGFGR